VVTQYILKKRELNLKVTNKDGKTAFDVAVEKGNHDVLRLILDEGGSVAHSCIEEALLCASKKRFQQSKNVSSTPHVSTVIYISCRKDTVDEKE
jgi:ankyrin repeat protein